MHRCRYKIAFDIAQDLAYITNTPRSRMFLSNCILDTILAIFPRLGLIEADALDHWRP
jgi:hypothetical protein